MPRTPFIAGNWKMNLNIPEACALINELQPLLEGLKGIDMAVIPPFVCIPAVSSELEALDSLKQGPGEWGIRVGAQNMADHASGAYTGEVSPDMLKSANVSLAVLGHSERRGYYGETDSSVNAKLKLALKSKLIPIVCVGEVLEEREKGLLKSVLRRQVTKALEGIAKDKLPSIVFAYEPVWAIGTGKNATGKDAQEGCEFIRSVIGELYHPSRADEVRIQYGGSVKAANVSEYKSLPDVDGALVGGASLKAEEFADIIKGWL